MRPRLARPAAAAISSVALVLLGPGVASATGTSVTITAASQGGSSVSVSGAASFVDQPFVALGTDAMGDTAAPGEDALGGDLTAASAATLLYGKVQLRWTVTQLPPATNGAPTGILYGWDFCVDAETCFEVDAQRMGPVAANTTGYGVLWSCKDPACTPADQSVVSEAIPVAFDGTAKTVTVTLSQAQLHALPGSIISPVALATDGAAFTGLGDASAFTYFYNNADAGVPDIADYQVGAKQVSLAVGGAGLDPASVAYTATGLLAGDGTFTGSVDVSGLAPGAYAVYARACYGAGNCGYATAPLTIT